MSRKDPLGLDWFKRPDQNYSVGRDKNFFVPPGGPISRYIENCVPAGHTFGELHDAGGDRLTENGWPDLLANVPTMPWYYGAAVIQEAQRSLGPSLMNLIRRLGGF